MQFLLKTFVQHTSKISIVLNRFFANAKPIRDNFIGRTSDGFEFNELRKQYSI